MKKLFYSFAAFAVISTSMFFASCSSDGDETPVPALPNGLLSDVLATDAPIVTENTVNIPNPSTSILEENGVKIAEMTLTGIQGLDGGFMRLNGNSQYTRSFSDSTAQNVWLEIDGTKKSLVVYNTIDGQDTNKKLLADVVFLVDNSGSMSEEAEAISQSIISWSDTLAKSGLDLQVGCLGYGDSRHAIDGGFNMNFPDSLAEWMNNNSYGTGRTYGFGGADAQELMNLAIGGNYENGTFNECGMVPLRFAHDNFKFREGASRIYINFTDEPNQPYGIEDWSVEYLNPENDKWKSQYGTVHTVFSEDSTYYSRNWRKLYYERPWLMSDYTGGTKLFTDAAFTNFTLENITVTGAMMNSYIIRFANIDQLINDGITHRVKITVQDDKKNQAVKEFDVEFSTQQPTLE